jgi:hypothetical protein
VETQEDRVNHHQQFLALFLGRCRAILYDGDYGIHVHSWLWSRKIRSVWRNRIGQPGVDAGEVPRDQ